MAPTTSYTTSDSASLGIGLGLPWRRILGVVSTLVFVAGVLVWAVLLSPRIVGGPASYVLVAGDSMQPLLHSGDLAVMRKQDEYAVGDVIAYRVPEWDVGAGAIVIHRIVGGGSHGYVTKGDNRSGDDLMQPTRNHILGKMWFSVDGAGLYAARLRNPMPLALFSALIAFALIATGRSQRRR